MKKWFSRLQVRMTLSYVAVSVFIILLFEILVSGFVYFALTRSPLLSMLAEFRAQVVAHNYALEAAVQADGNTLNPHSTFQPGLPDSIKQPESSISAGLDQLINEVPYEAGASPSQPPGLVALLVSQDGNVLASSFPVRFPASKPASQVIPSQAELVSKAMAGKPGSQVIGSGQEQTAAAAETVWSKNRQPIGVVYVQTPIGNPRTPLFSGILYGWLRSIFLWAFVMLPFGAVFGFLTTRRLVRRIHRLVDASATFSRGDYSQRVPAGGADEIGQLEQQFNLMAEQLVESIHRQKEIAEQSARREERARIEQEMRTAQYIQQALLPKELPALPGWQLAPFYRPAREVGGDLYDFLPLPGGSLGIAIGDVTGKGIPAALMMASICTMLRSAAPHAGSPGALLGQVNELLYGSIPSGMFVTCFYAILDPVSGRLRYANAGHDLPYRLHDNSVSELRARGMPLGLMPGAQYEEFEVTLDRDETVLFFTDGLVEAHNPQRKMFGLPRLEGIIQACDHQVSLIDALLSELAAFTGEGWEQEDDVTLLLLRRGG